MRNKELESKYEPTCSIFSYKRLPHFLISNFFASASLRSRRNDDFSFLILYLALHVFRSAISP